MQVLDCEVVKEIGIGSGENFWMWECLNQGFQLMFLRFEMGLFLSNRDWLA